MERNPLLILTYIQNSSEPVFSCKYSVTWALLGPVGFSNKKNIDEHFKIKKAKKHGLHSETPSISQECFK